MLKAWGLTHDQHSADQFHLLAGDVDVQQLVSSHQGRHVRNVGALGGHDKNYVPAVNARSTRNGLRACCDIPNGPVVASEPDENMILRNHRPSAVRRKHEEFHGRCRLVDRKDHVTGDLELLLDPERVGRQHSPDDTYCAPFRNTRESGEVEFR